MRGIPRQFTSVESAKRRKSGRPKDSDQDEAFERVCVFLEENDEEQLTISDLVAKMGEYLQDSKSTAYGNQYLKEKLISRYGNSIFVTEGRSGVKNSVTFREKTCNILREYYNSPWEGDKEAQKRAIIQTAAKLIKSDIKTTVTPMGETYQLRPNWILPQRKILSLQVCDSCCSICLLGRIRPERLLASGKLLFKLCVQEL